MSKIQPKQLDATTPQEITHVHVALSPYILSDEYNRHAGATMESIMANSSLPVTMHLLYDARLSHGKEDEEAYNKSCYRKIAQKYQGEVFFHNLEMPSWLDSVPALKKWGAGTIMRLYLPELLPDVDKIIYFDCDMIVTADVGKLFLTDLGDFSIGASPDSNAPSFSRHRRRFCRKKQIPVSTYFCAGTLVLDLAKLRQDGFTEKVLSYFKKNTDLPFLDQDLLNWYCQGAYLKLDAKYNIYASARTPLEIGSDAVLHYASTQKPWKRYIGPIDDFYWKYLLATPWCEDRERLLQFVRMAPDVSRAYTLFQTDFFGNQDGGYVSRVWRGVKLMLALPWSIMKRAGTVMRLASLKIIPPRG